MGGQLDQHIRAAGFPLTDSGHMQLPAVDNQKISRLQFVGIRLDDCRHPALLKPQEFQILMPVGGNRQLVGKALAVLAALAADAPARGADVYRLMIHLLHQLMPDGFCGSQGLMVKHTGTPFLLMKPA